MCGLLQQNPKLLPEPMGKMEVEPPTGQDPFEQLGQTLNSVSAMLDDKKVRRSLNSDSRSAYFS